MKKLLLAFTLISTVAVAQTTTDSISTSLGDFVLVSEEEVEESTGYIDETSTTADGGTAEFVEISSGARHAAPLAEGSKMIVNLMPNPTGGLVEMNIAGVTGAVSITVTDIVGQTVYTSSVTVDGQRTTYLPAQTWASGTYIVMVNAADNIFAERLVVR